MTDNLRDRIAAVLYERSVLRAGLDFAHSLRDRIAKVLYQQWFRDKWPVRWGEASDDDKAVFYGDADAVIAELDLENRIASAVQGYAQSEMVGIDYHDPMRRETAYEAMQKLNREAVGIARYAMTYRPDWKANDE